MNLAKELLETSTKVRNTYTEEHRTVLEQLVFRAKDSANRGYLATGTYLPDGLFVEPLISKLGDLGFKVVTYPGLSGKQYISISW